ncbi:MAG: winged helix-turn-helix transcriptional regulator [Acidobacteriota bacterium]|nr:winged helix-turn-helix transcriptional regulator [Acidobacteriota bacterium]
MSPSPTACSLTTLFTALADQTRLRLLHLMQDREVCVCVLAEVLQLSQPKISRHLASLRRSGLVQARRDGKWMHYRVAPLPDARLDAILRATLLACAQDAAMQTDQQRLTRASCDAPALIQLDQ